MEYYRVNALIIRVKEFQEADRLLTMYSPERGKHRAVARGARRPRNRLSGSTQLFCYGSYSLFGGKGLDSVSQGEITESFIGLREELWRMAYAAYLAEMVDELVEEDEPNAELFALLLNAYYLLERGDDPELVARYFEIRLLTLLGYRPEIDQCANCGNDTFPGGEMWLSPAHGSVLCRDCYRIDPQAVRISAGSRETLKHLQAVDAARLRVLKLSPAIQGELERVLRAFWDQHLPRPLKSLEFLQMVKLTEGINGKKGERFDD